MTASVECDWTTTPTTAEGWLVVAALFAVDAVARVVREVAAGDGSIGRLLNCHQLCCGRPA